MIDVRELSEPLLSTHNVTTRDSLTVAASALYQADRPGRESGLKGGGGPILKLIAPPEPRTLMPFELVAAADFLRLIAMMGLYIWLGGMVGCEDPASPASRRSPRSVNKSLLSLACGVNCIFLRDVVFIVSGVQMKLTSRMLKRIIKEEIETALIRKLIKEDAGAFGSQISASISKSMKMPGAGAPESGSPESDDLKELIIQKLQLKLPREVWQTKGIQNWIERNDKLIGQVVNAAGAVSGKLGAEKAAQQAVEMFVKNLATMKKEAVERALLRKLIREAMALDPQISANIDKFVARQAPTPAVDDDAVRGQVEAELGKQLKMLGMDSTAAMKWIMDPKNEPVIQMISKNTTMSGDAKREVEKFVKNVAVGSSMKESRRRAARRKSK